MNKKIIIIPIIIIIIIIGAITIPQLTNLYSNDEFIVTEAATMISVPNGVKLINSNNGIEIYGNDYTKFIVVNNNDTDLIDELEKAFTDGEQISKGIYKINNQYIGNNFNIWTGENLAIKEDTLYTTYAENDTTGEYIFCISKSQTVCDVNNWDIEWGNKTIITNTPSDTSTSVNKDTDKSAYAYTSDGSPLYSQEEVDKYMGEKYGLVDYHIKDNGYIDMDEAGYDDIPVEPKGKDKYILPKEEVPDMITVCNNIPRFKEGFDESILQRAIIFEFLNKFRGTDNENNNLEDEILNNSEEMEYLIYKGIQAYKEMIENKRDFTARITEAETMELLGKHTDPIPYILNKLVKWNPQAEDDGEDYITPNELNKLVRFVSKKEGLNLTGLNKKGLIKSNVLIGAIRREFNFDKSYATESKQCIYNENTNKYEYGRVYPNICKTAEYNIYLKEMEDNNKD